MIENWAYAALAEHIYRRNQRSDQALREEDLSEQGGLAATVLRVLTGDDIATLDSLGLFVSEGRYIYNPDTGFEATIAQGAAGELIVVFRGTDFISLVTNDDGYDVDTNIGWGLGADREFILDCSQWAAFRSPDFASDGQYARNGTWRQINPEAGVSDVRPPAS